MAEESRRAVLAAMGANLGIAAGKLTAGLFTGSGAMLAEAGHSLADTFNQVFLLLGLNLARTKSDEQHPHGHGKEGFFWSFLTAIFIFVAGASFSVYEGVRTLLQNDTGHHTRNELVLAYSVLALAVLFESTSWFISVRVILRDARERQWSFLRFLRRSPNLTVKGVFWEDSAAIIGLSLAAAGLGLSEVTGTERWDAVASLGIGVVLAFAAFVLGMQSRSLLLGKAANPETREAIRNVVRGFPEITGIVRILTMQIGVESVLVTGEVEVSRDLTTEQIEELLARIDARLSQTVPEVTDTFWELRPCPKSAKTIR